LKSADSPLPAGANPALPTTHRPTGANPHSSAESALPYQSYDSYRWAQGTYSHWGRLIEVGRIGLQFLVYLWADRQDWSYPSRQATPEAQAQRRRQRAIWIRESLLHLGPTFIKVGQFFSTRADLFPVEYIEELSKLQDQVPAFGYEQVTQIIEQELGDSVAVTFKSFSPVPIASASLGQVHYGQLHSGEEVAVKVQRPGLKQLFSIDLGILRGFAEFVQYRTPWGKDGRDWLGIYEECHQNLWGELDYLNEGRNANLFRRNFQNQLDVIVPRVHWRYTTPRLLTMEYIPGIKVNDVEALGAAGIDRVAIAQLGARSYLSQILHHGFFHADPHPGNIAVNPDGALIFYDFGMMGQLPPKTKDRLMLNFRGILQNDANLVVQAMVELGALAPDSDLGPVRRSVQYMLDSYFDRAFSDHGEISMAAINDDLYELTYDQPFRFPAAFTFVLRSLSALEALGKYLDPNFNFMDVAQPFAEEIMAQEPSSSSPNNLIGQLGRQAAEFTNTSLNLPQRLEVSLNKLDQGDIKMRVNSVEANRELRKLNTTSLGVIYSLLFSILFICATQLLIANLTGVATALAACAVVPLTLLLRLLLFKLDRSGVF
jgi:predicted unusual protein kinase regulating ubiquinone biosynthesis (AarF/ABC1/UbiB family)